MSTRTVAPLAGALILLAAAWWFTAPTAVGGRASYVVTHGVSMQPQFHTGDLAIVYPARTYRNGDIAAYRSELLGTTVLHRIIATTPGGYLFKGDNNTWIDPENPTRQQVVGRLVIRVPHGGVVLGSIHRPLVPGLLATALLAAGSTAATRHRRRRRRRTRAERAPMNLPSINTDSRSGRTRSAVAGTVALLFACLAVGTFLVPSQSRYVEQVPWTTAVSYDYTAQVPANLVYPGGQIRSGQTVFRRLADRLTIRADWSLHAAARHQIEGTGTLEAVVQGPAGWTHTVQLASPRDITGDRVMLVGTLDLRALDTVVAQAGALTGIPADHYTVLVRPVVQLGGTLAGTAVTGASGPQPALALAVTPSTAIPAAGTGSSAPSTGGTNERTPGTAQADPLVSGLHPAPTRHTTAVARTGSAAWNLLGHQLPVAPIHWIAITATALSFSIAVLLLLIRPAEGDPCDRHLRRHRGSTISISGVQLATGSNVVELASMNALVEVARRYDRLILHQADTGLYLVEDETGLYRYRCTHHRDRTGRRQHLATRPLRSDITTKSA